MRKMFKSAICAGASLLAVGVYAADRSWTGALSSDGMLDGNWNPASVPTKDTSIAVGETATPVSMTLSGSGTLFEFKGGDFGNAGSGHSVTISGGAKALSYANFSVGGWANDCTVTVDGAGSELGVISDLSSGVRMYAGSSGSNNLLLFQNGSSGHVPIGAWSFLCVGNGGSFNKLQIDGSGTAFYAADTRVGNGGSTNAIVVTGGGAFYATNSVSAGNNTGWGSGIFVTNGVFEAMKPNGARVDMTFIRGSRFVFSGPSARGLIGGFTAKTDSSMEILDGAVVTNYAQMSFSHDGTVGVNGNCWLLVSNATLNAGYNINAGNFVDNSKIIVMDGGKIYNPTMFFDIGSFAAAHDNEMIIDGVGSFASCARWRIGGQGYCNRGIVRNGGEMSSPAVQISNGNVVTCVSNAVEVLDGGKITLTGWNGSITSYANTSNSIVRVKNGTITGSGTSNKITLYNESVLRLEGTTTKIKVTSLELKNNCAIEFVPPPDAASVDEPYVTLSASSNPVLVENGLVLRVVDARSCQKNGGGMYTLVSSPNASLSGIVFSDSSLPEGAKVIYEEHAIKVKIPRINGTVVIIR